MQGSIPVRILHLELGQGIRQGCIQRLVPFLFLLFNIPLNLFPGNPVVFLAPSFLKDGQFFPEAAAANKNLPSPSPRSSILLWHSGHLALVALATAILCPHSRSWHTSILPFFPLTSSMYLPHSGHLFLVMLSCRIRRCCLLSPYNHLGIVFHFLYKVLFLTSPGNGSKLLFPFGGKGR